MRVAIVGAGALGCVYGARLARFGGCDVTLVARSPAPPAAERLERVDDGEVLRWEAPARVASAPRDADVVVAFVRYEQLMSIPPRVAGTAAPIVVMTPMMPEDHAALCAALPGRVLAGMPGVVSYRNDAGAVRYWLPRVATTLIEERTPAGAEAELAARLRRAEVPAKLARGVLERNVATTVSFVPLAMALDVAGSADALLADEALLDLALRAAAEGRRLGRTVGREAAARGIAVRAEPWASLLLRFAGPRLLAAGVRLARARAPEAVAYAERHFGRKLHAQNVAMAGRMLELAKEKGAAHAALAALLDRLRATP